MDKQYRLPLVAMVETMKCSPQCVLLQAQLVSLPGISKQACVAHVIVGQGALHSCRITGATGLLLQQRAAYEALARCGDVDWLVLPAPVSPAFALASGARSKGGAPGTLGSMPDHPERSEPCGTGTLWGGIPILRVSPLPRETLAQFPRGFRIALVLIDGKRSIEEIAQVLKKTPHEIQQILAQVPHLVKLER